jgi:hypothetical protein
MAEVRRANGFVFHIYSNDHEPSHVHVYKSGKWAVINLGDNETRPEIRESRMARRDARKALTLAGDAQEDLLGKWREIHGKDKGGEMGVHGSGAERATKGS